MKQHLKRRLPLTLSMVLNTRRNFIAEPESIERQFERLTIMRDGIGALALLGQEITKIIMSDRVGWIKLQGGLKM